MGETKHDTSNNWGLTKTLSLSHHYTDSLALQEENNNSNISLLKRMAISA
jgi:hypothetical protein